MSQCESRLYGVRCVLDVGHSEFHRSEHGGAWVDSGTDEQADEPELTQIDPPGHEEYVKQLDPILAKTGKSREWWRYHFAGKMTAAAVRRGWAGESLRDKIKEGIEAADMQLEELEK